VDVQTSEEDAKLAPVNVDHTLLYADRSSKDEQLLMRLFFKKTKDTNVEGSW
jgi:hypothetical protein